MTGSKGGVPFSSKFTKYKMSSGFDNPNTDAFGKIIARVRVECDGKYRVTEWNVSGTTWNGSNEDMMSTFYSFLKESYFEKNGEGCGESALVTLDVKKTY